MVLFFYKWNAVNENRVIAGLEALGHELVINDKKFDNYEIDAKLITELLMEFHAHKCQAFFSMNYYPFLSLAAEAANVPYISWSQDAPLFTHYSPTIRYKGNYIFTFDKEEYYRILAMGGNAYHLPLASDDEHFHKVTTANDMDYIYDISFVGSAYSHTDFDNWKDMSELNKGYYDGVMRGQHVIYGGNIIKDCISSESAEELLEGCGAPIPEGYMIDNITAAAYVLEKKLTAIERHEYLKIAGEVASLTIFTGGSIPEDINAKVKPFVNYDNEMPVVFNRSKINLNFTARNIHTGVPLRVFDVLASKGFLISSYQLEIAECFENNKELVMFSSENELRELIAYYLENDKEREEIAYAGYERIKKEYSWHKQLNKIFELIG